MEIDQTDRKIPDGKGYVICRVHKWYTLVPFEESRRVVFEHLRQCPDHRDVGRSDSATNLEIYAQTGTFVQVDEAVFNPRSTPNSTG